MICRGAARFFTQALKLLEEARTLRDALAGPPVRAPSGLADRIVNIASRLNADPSSAEGETAAHPADVSQSG